jgi:murein DD-endopeptidase MepM/ murein hydrolase activator NlpD
MRRWEHHRTRSKVALLLLINLVTLLGGKYTALMTSLKIEFLGEAIAYAKTPKKRVPKSHLVRGPRAPTPPPGIADSRAKLHGKASNPHATLHVIRQGDSLSGIADAYGVSLEALRRANRLPHTSHILVGETLRIPPRENTQELATLNQTFQSSDRSLFLGVQRHLERRSHPQPKARHHFLWPVEGSLTSPFGERGHVMGGGGSRFHAGIDLAVPRGTPVQAAQEGIVTFAGYNGAYGKAVKLDHLNGFSTLYAHNSRILVHVGQTVKAGEVICLSGSTGRSTGPHLHFEVHKDGWPVDPLHYLP